MVSATLAGHSASETPVVPRPGAAAVAAVAGAAAGGAWLGAAA